MVSGQGARTCFLTTVSLPLIKTFTDSGKWNVLRITVKRSISRFFMSKLAALLTLRAALRLDPLPSEGGGPEGRGMGEKNGVSPGSVNA